MKSNMNSGEKMGSIRWYHRPAVVILAVLAAGPFALPLVWYNPGLKKIYKWIITVLVLALTAYIVMISIDVVKKLMVEFKNLSEALK